MLLMPCCFFVIGSSVRICTTARRPHISCSKNKQSFNHMRDNFLKILIESASFYLYLYFYSALSLPQIHVEGLADVVHLVQELLHYTVGVLPHDYYWLQQGFENSLRDSFGSSVIINTVKV